MNSRSLLRILAPLLVVAIGGAAWWFTAADEGLAPGPATARGVAERGALADSSRTSTRGDSDGAARAAGGDADQEGDGTRVEPGTGGLFSLRGWLRDPGREVLEGWRGALQLVESPPGVPIDVLGKRVYAARLDGLGGYRFDDLPAGQYAVFAYAGLVEPLRVALTLDGTPRAVRRDLELAVPMRVEVLVEDPEDLAAFSAFTSARAHSPRVTASVPRGALGEREVARIEWLDVELDQLDQLDSRHEEQAGRIGELLVPARPPLTLRLTYGSLVVDELVVREWTRTWRVRLAPASLESSLGEVRVRFVDADGQPAGHGVAQLRGLLGGEATRSRLAADGVQRFAAVPPGAYLLTYGPSLHDQSAAFSDGRFGWQGNPTPSVRAVAEGRSVVVGPLSVSVAARALVDLGDVRVHAGRVLTARVAGLPPDDGRYARVECALVVRGAETRLVPWGNLLAWRASPARVILPDGQYALRAVVEPENDPRGPSLERPEPRIGYVTPWVLCDGAAEEVSLGLEPMRAVSLENASGGPLDWVLRDALGLEVVDGTLATDESDLLQLPLGRFELESLDAVGAVERAAVRVDEEGATIVLD